MVCERLLVLAVKAMDAIAAVSSSFADNFGFIFAPCWLVCRESTQCVTLTERLKSDLLIPFLRIKLYTNGPTDQQ